jgi:hypothetical protein
MSEILTQLSSPAWWFSTILAGVVVNIASNYLFDALRRRGLNFPERAWPKQSILLWVIVAFATLYLFSSLATGLGAEGRLEHFWLLTWMCGIVFFRTMLTYMPRWPAGWSITVLILTGVLIVIGLNVPWMAHYKPITLPFVYFFVAASTALNLVLAAWHYSTLLDQRKGKSDAAQKRQ